LWCRGSGDFITTENVSVNGIVSGAGSATAAWFVDGGGTQNGYKLWNTSFSNLDKFALETYRANNFTAQKVTLRNCVNGIYQKSSGLGHTAFSLRFIDFGTASARFSSQSGSEPASFTIVQHCVFANTNEAFGYDQIRFDWLPTDGNSDKHWIVGNVFYNYDFSSLASIRFEEQVFSGAQIFNNIFLLSDRPWKFDIDSPELADFNCYWDAGTSMEFIDNNITYTSLGSIQSSTTFEQNSTRQDPLFVDAINGDFTLQANSPALDGGVSNTQQGLFLDDFYTIGAD
jgi:hypothetical protein